MFDKISLLHYEAITLGTLHSFKTLFFLARRTARSGTESQIWIRQMRTTLLIAGLIVLPSRRDPVFLPSGHEPTKLFCYPTFFLRAEEYVYKDSRHAECYATSECKFTKDSMEAL